MNSQKLVEIQYAELAPETLQNVLEAFVLREGTSYGKEEVSFETKVEQVRRQLEAKRVKLVYDLESETCTFLTDHQIDELEKRKSKVGPESESPFR